MSEAVGRGRARLGVTSIWAVGAVVLSGAAIAAHAGLLEDGVDLVVLWLVELWFLGGVALCLWRLRPLAAIDTTGSRLLLLGIVAALFAVQAAPTRPEPYPFTNWSMYSSSEPELVYARFEMVADGADVGHLPIADIVPNTLGRGFMARLEERLRAAGRGDQAAEDVLAETLRTLVVAHGDPGVDAIDVRWCRAAERAGQVRSRCRSALVVER